MFMPLSRATFSVSIFRANNIFTKHSLQAFMHQIFSLEKREEKAHKKQQPSAVKAYLKATRWPENPLEASNLMSAYFYDAQVIYQMWEIAHVNTKKKSRELLLFHLWDRTSSSSIQRALKTKLEFFVIISRRITIKANSPWSEQSHVFLIEILNDSAVNMMGWWRTPLKQSANNQWAEFLCRLYVPWEYAAAKICITMGNNFAKDLLAKLQGRNVEGLNERWSLWMN